MAIVENIRMFPCDDSDDHRPQSTHGSACDPSKPDAPYVRDLVVTIDVIAPGDPMPIHTHPTDEIVYIASGVGDSVLGDERRTVGPGTVLFIPAGTPHGGRNVGDTPMTAVGVFPSETISITMLERVPAPGTEDDPLPPPFEINVREEFEAMEMPSGES